PEALTQQVRGAGRRVRTCREDLQQRRLAGPVGTEDDPALPLGDGPVDGVDDRGGAASDGDALQVEYRAHGARPYRSGEPTRPTVGHLAEAVHEASRQAPRHVRRLSCEA